MINSASNVGGAAPLENKDETDSQSQLESNLSNKVVTASGEDPRLRVPELNGSVADRQQPEIASTSELKIGKIPQIEQSNTPVKPVSSQDRLMVTAELDSMLTSLQLTTPHPPQPNSKPESTTSVSVIHPQKLLQQINEARQQLDIAQAQLQNIEQRNQTQVERVDANTLEVKQIKFRIQQLAQYSKNQLERAAEILAEIVTIRTEIAANLDKFGGEGEIQQMLSQLEPTRHALILAHDRVVTGQETFYESLQEIQARVTAIGQESEAKLRQEHELMQNLAQTISTDRLQIASMSVEMSSKLNELHGLSTQITTIHAQIIEKSQTFQSKIESIERGFAEISQSMQAEKQQFYALTAESIERTDLMRPQLTEISKKIDDDRVKTAKIESAISSIRTNAKQSEEQQLTNFELRDREMILLANNFQIDRNKQLAAIKKMSTWLWIMSGMVGVLFILVLRLSLSLR